MQKLIIIFLAILHGSIVSTRPAVFVISVGSMNPLPSGRSSCAIFSKLLPLVSWRKKKAKIAMTKSKTPHKRNVPLISMSINICNFRDATHQPILVIIYGVVIENTKLKSH